MQPDILAQFNVDPGDYDDIPRNGDGAKVLNVRAFAGGKTDKAGKDRAGRWLRNAMIGVALLALAAAVVSFSAQYLMVHSVKHNTVIAGLEAGIPDVAAMIFASLGIAMALNGKRAIRPRLLNIGAIATSVTMNVLAAGHGWRDLAIWAMPPIAYALASDTLITVVRAWTIARDKAMAGHLADEDTPLALIGGAFLWLLRLTLAPVSTLSGFRSWVVDEVSVAPGRKAGRPVAAAPARTAIGSSARRARRAGKRHGPSKTSRFLELVGQRHGEIGSIPLTDVSPICRELAPEVGLDPGAARTALRGAVLAGRDGGTS